MKKALTFTARDRPFPLWLPTLLLANDLRPFPLSAETIFDQLLDPSVGILLLDSELLTGFEPEKRGRLAAFCRLKNLTVLLVGERLSSSSSFVALAWNCGVIRNSSDREEWAEKIALYRHLGRLEHEVSDLKNKLNVRWREDKEDLRSAAQIQQSLLPKKLPSLPHFNVSCHFHPCEMIGGDLFNLNQVDEETLMLYLLDVSGHGISSAMVSISVYQSLSLHTGQIVKRTIDKPPYYRLLPPVEVMGELCREYPFERFELFFTIVYMLINIHTGETRYCTAGHPPPILQRKDGELHRLSIGGGLIGLPDTGPFEQGEITLNQGDRLFLFSDGLIDHTDAAGECFGEQRLMQNLTRNDSTLQQSCLAGIDAMHNFRGEMPSQDDVSLLGVEFTKSSV